MVSLDLLNRYNVPTPRYTSYPTVPFWQENIDGNKWKEVCQTQLDEANNAEGISLYIHLPFCASLCTYCGCNKKITTNHSVEGEYMKMLIKEWRLYRSLMTKRPIIRELHLGGGTPTFFAPENLEILLSAILADCDIHPNHEFSFEGHPNNTTVAHLQTLYRIGFRRVSYGVQDHNERVQRVINRMQPLETVKQAVRNAREVGFQSVNFDLIYGLPLQTLDSIRKTIQQSIELKPDRVAFYSYAHVPWTSKAQRLFDETDLPDAALKMQLYLAGKELFTAAGYTDIGMDHFALPGDDLCEAWNEGTLHRNFMGYTTQRTSMLLGLGVSSISDAGIAFAQNHKTIHDYYASIEKGELAVTKGCFLNDEDVIMRKYILDISCQGRTEFKPEHLSLFQPHTFDTLDKLKEDGLIHWNQQQVRLTDTGRHFIRNVCKAFDQHLLRNEMNQQKVLFSKAV